MAVGTLLLFTKPARPGRVKTRLIGALTAAQAADLHGAFVEDLAERLRSAPFSTQLAWAVDDGEQIPEGPRPGCSLGLPGVLQQGADLGERLYRALMAAAISGDGVAAVGSDHPDLPSERVEEAFALLRAGAEVVLGPATDGGYYLIALAPQAVRARLFEGIAWSTASVLADTLDRCRELGLSVELLAPAHDVDTPEDLRRLALSLATAAHGWCPRTRALLDDWGWTAREVVQ
jgi:uncharacterized protein